jgi:hypothetical protein
MTTGRSRSIGRSAISSSTPASASRTSRDVWDSEPLFYPAKPPADWLMVAEVSGRVLMVPLAPSNADDPRKCRPIGCNVAADHLARRYREDR